jgi:SagB-type dehydrogenase family enzyme
MGPKILWVLLPLVLYGLLLVLAWRGRAPSRVSVNMHGSLLLMVYLLCTAGLGIFWVANQQLPVFDWHFLFGYATLLLVSLHLFFNLPVLLRWLRQRRAAAPASPASPASPARRGWRRMAACTAAPVALGLAFWLGTQYGDGPAPDRPALEDPIQTVLRFHEHSSESRTSAFRRAPVPALDAQPPVFKSYPDAPHVALERGAPARDARSLGAMLRGPGAGRPLTLPALGQLLYLSAGVTAHRGGLALRAAPSSGALFPAELYIAARRVDGLPAGLYHYDPEHHRLDGLGALPPAFAPVLGDAEALVVVAAIFDRTAWKYRNRAYRYVAADLGHLLENVRLAGHYAGLPVRLPVLFDESRAAQAFALDGRQEGVLALAYLGGQAGAAGASPGAAFAGGGDAGANAAGQAGVAGGGKPGTGTGTATAAPGVTGAVHAATSMGAGAAGDASAPGATAAEAQMDMVRLPRAEAAKADLYGTIVKRRSQRRFAADAVAQEELAALLAEMAQKPLLSDAMRADLVVNRVAGIAPGVYRYLPQQHALKLVRSGQFAAQAQSAALSQEVIGGAAVVLILSAERAPMFAAHGARGYRLAFLEAGMMGQRWLLGATARGLAACPVGAFYDDEAAALVSAAPQQRWVLHFAALGRPAP